MLIEALIKEVQLRKEALNNQMVTTIYFGGGTPSLLSTSELEAIINSVYSYHSVIKNPEITLEANPDDLLSFQKSSGTVFEHYKTIGINRLSIGIQSFFDDDLQLMNRAHKASEAINCLTTATQHFDNISVDLIYGIPGMTNKKWIDNIRKALSFKIPHISSYALTVEPKTAVKTFIKKGVIPQVNDAQAQEQFYLLVDVLEQHHFIHYELSNFAKKGFFSENNSGYWQGKPYIGIGPSAHSFDGKKRSWNIHNNAKYIASLKENRLPAEEEILTVTDGYNEYIMTGLRTMWGVSLQKVAKDFGKTYLTYLIKQSEKYILEELLYIEGETLKATAKGKFLSDGIASDLFKLNLS